MIKHLWRRFLCWLFDDMWSCPECGGRLTLREASTDEFIYLDVETWQVCPSCQKRWVLRRATTTFNDLS